MNLLYYLLEANLYLSIFYGLYLLILRNETFYQLNRAWLLVSSALAFVIPIIQLGFLRSVKQAVQAVPLTTGYQLQPVFTTAAKPAVHHYNWYLIIYLAIAAVMLGFLLFKIAGLIRLSRSAVKRVDGKYTIVQTADRNAFSFFNYLFVGSDLASSQTVMQHELIHIRQKHSYDVIYFELLRVICWFNPLVHLMQNSLKELHEFIADKATADLEYGADHYTDFLIGSAYGLPASDLANTFFNNNQLKKRIMMLHKQPSGRSARLKYLLAVPLCGGLLCVSTFGFTKNYGWINIAPSRPFQQHEVTVKTDEKVNNWENDYTNAKGYHIHEKIVNTNGAEVKTVTITEKDGTKHNYVEGQLSASDKKMLLDKFGFTFAKTPNKPLSITLDSTPPPSRRIDFARPKVLPTTSKGYKYFETGYRISGKSDYRVIIIEKNKEEKEFWRSKASAADIKLLKDKYGYIFPAGPINVKMPPPPPVVSADIAPVTKTLQPPLPVDPADIASDHKMPPPPPPANPADIAGDHKMPPPPPPVVHADKIKGRKMPSPPANPADKIVDPKTPPPPPPAPPKEISLNSVVNGDDIVFKGMRFSNQRPANFKANPESIVIVNGTKVFITPVSERKTVQISATDSTVAYNSNDKWALEKWGDDAKEGILELNGQVYASVK